MRMTTSTVRVSAHSREMLLRLTKRSGRSMQQVIEDALDEYERQQYFAEMQAGYERLRADPEAWAEYQAELEEWDAVLADGLEDE
jgi:hypothetical protein